MYKLEKHNGLSGLSAFVCYSSCQDEVISLTFSGVYAGGQGRAEFSSSDLQVQGLGQLLTEMLLTSQSGCLIQEPVGTNS